MHISPPLSFLLAALLALPSLSQAALIQLGDRYTTNPGLSPGGTVFDVNILTLDTAAFVSAGLWDSVSNTVGGGTVSGTLYIAFTARALDRQSGSPSFFPSGLTTLPGFATPNSSFGGGELWRGGSSPIVGIGNFWNAWAYSSYGLGGEGDLSPRIDVHPQATITFLAELIFNPSGTDTVNITAFYGSPFAPISTHTRTVTGDASFSTWRFRSGHDSTTANNRWAFSNSAFATTREAALLAVPEPRSLPVFGLLALALTRRRPRSPRS